MNCTVASGGSCALTCGAGYTKSGDATCTGGSWSAQTCDANPCNSQPTDPADGTFAVSSIKIIGHKAV